MNSEIVLEINQGKLKGLVKTDYKNGTYYSFQGIPYAQPPVGQLRFKNPVPPKKWTGVLDATKEASESLSRHLLEREKIIGSEDCLYLNVYTPQLPKNGGDFKPKPVMFWIHGGGFLYGSGNTDLYGPGYLVTEDVVLVTINYRLGILGFLSLDDPSLEVSGNAGLKDMVQALKWVQENINDFGGDPKNVTIFGESAGSAACHLLILSPVSKGLFHKAILQSGSALNPWLYGLRGSKKIADVLEFDTTSEKDVLEFLQSVPAQNFMDFQDKIADSLGCDIIRSVSFVIEKPSSTESNFLTQHPLEIIASGNYNKVPIIIGYTDREGLISEMKYLKEYGSIQIDQLQNFVTHIPWYYNVAKDSEMEKTIANKIKKFYFGNDDVTLENIDQYFKLVTDTLFWRGIYVTMKEHLKQSDEIYLYRFMLDSDLNLLKKYCKINRKGACHCDDLGYLFKSQYLPDFAPDSFEAKSVEKVVKLWANFAKFSKPTNSETDSLLNIKWTPVEDDAFNCLDIAENLAVHSKPDLERMEFWNEVSKLLGSKF